MPERETATQLRLPGMPRCHAYLRTWVLRRVEVVSYALVICPRSLWKHLKGTAILYLNNLKQFSTDRAWSSERCVVIVTESNGNVNAHFLKRGNGSICDYRENRRRQGQPKGNNFVLICLSFEGRPKKQPESWKDRGMKACLQVYCHEPISVPILVPDTC